MTSSTSNSKCNCKTIKAKDLVIYDKDNHFCCGKMRKTCTVCGNTEATTSSYFEFVTIHCDECNSKIKTYHGWFQKSGSIIRGMLNDT